MLAVREGCTEGKQHEIADHCNRIATEQSPPAGAMQLSSSVFHANSSSSCRASLAAHSHRSHSAGVVVHANTNSSPGAVPSPAAVQHTDRHRSRLRYPSISSRRCYHRRTTAAAATGSGPDSSSPTAGNPSPVDPSTAAAEADEGAEDAVAYGPLSDEPGPAFRDTLAMLEWGRLCAHLAKHSSTSLGKRLCLQLSVPLQEATSLRLQQEVR